MMTKSRVDRTVKSGNVGEVAMTKAELVSSLNK